MPRHTYEDDFLSAAQRQRYR